MKYYSAFKIDVGLYLLMWQESHNTIQMEKKKKSGRIPFIQNYYFPTRYVQKDLERLFLDIRFYCLLFSFLLCCLIFYS